jgi:hypothetical protein
MKMEFGAQNQYGRLGFLHGARKNILFEVKRVKKRLQIPRTEFGAQN